MPLEDQPKELEDTARRYEAKIKQALQTLSFEELREFVREVEEILGTKFKDE